MGKSCLKLFFQNHLQGQDRVPGSTSVEANLKRQSAPDINLYRSCRLCVLSETCARGHDIVGFERNVVQNASSRVAGG